MVSRKGQRWQLERQLQSSQSKLETWQSGGGGGGGVRGHGVSWAESCRVSVRWKPKHITLNPRASCPARGPEQGPHSSSRPVPTFRLFEVEPARPITDWTWTWGWRLRLRLGWRVWGRGQQMKTLDGVLLRTERFDTGKRKKRGEAAAARAASILTLHMPGARTRRRKRRRRKTNLLSNLRLEANVAHTCSLMI